MSNAIEALPLAEDTVPTILRKAGGIISNAPSIVSTVELDQMRKDQEAKEQRNMDALLRRWVASEARTGTLSNLASDSKGRVTSQGVTRVTTEPPSWFKPIVYLGVAVVLACVALICWRHRRS